MEKSIKIMLMLLSLGMAAGIVQSVIAVSGEANGMSGDPMIGAGLAIGLAGLGAGLGMGTASAAAIGAIAEKPEMFSKTLIFIVFIEAIAIYGLVIAFMLLMGG